MKKRLCLFAVLIAAAMALSCATNASVLTLYPEIVYDYLVYICGELSLEGVETDADCEVFTNAFDGATLTLSDGGGKSVEANCSEVFLNDVSIAPTEPTDSLLKLQTSILTQTSDKLSFSACLSLGNGKTEPSTLVDFSALSLDAEFIIKSVEEEAEATTEETGVPTSEVSEVTTAEEVTEETEEEPTMNGDVILTLEALKIDKVIARKADSSFSSEISVADFNNGRGLKVNEKEEIAISDSEFKVKAVFLEPLSKASTAELKTDLLAEAKSIALEEGAYEAVFSIPSNSFYDISMGEFFKTLDITVGGCAVELKSLKIYYSADMSLYGAMRFREIIVNKGATSVPVGSGFHLWTSYPRTVATVNSSGEITGKQVGTAQVNAYDTLWRSTICAVTVISSEIPSTEISLPYDEAVIRVGCRYKLPYTLTPSDSTDAVMWTSSDSDIVQINSKTGELLGKAPGTATVTALTSGGRQTECKLTVKLPE